MNIKELAEQAGLYDFVIEVMGINSEIQKLAELVAAAEREACAKLCDEWGEAASVELAAAIRARGEK